MTMAALPLWFGLQLIDECFGRVQQPLEGAGPGAIDGALARCQRQEERRCEAELLGIKGGLRLVHSVGDAEAYFYRSLDSARRHQARAWELRAATSSALLRRGSLG